jgi:hypothetical protein
MRKGFVTRDTVWIDREIAAGRIKDYAEAARVIGVSRARVAKVMRLTQMLVADGTFVSDRAI